MDPYLEFITGIAGTGKTTLLRNRIDESRHQRSIGKVKRSYGTLCATTGIAAINLSSTDNIVTTINSELKFFDTESLEDNAAGGKLSKALQGVAIKGRNLVVDEISMMEDKQLDLIYKSLVEVNQLDNIQSRGGLGLVLCGDFCQLPPINGQPIYKAKCWEKFAEHTTKLTKVYRQDNQQFLEGLNMARAGDGDKAAEVFSSLPGITWIGTVNSRFSGTTIVSTNKEVDRINQVRLDRLIHNEHKQEIRIRNFRWGKQKPEWKQVPDELVLAEGAYVMILTNDAPDFGFVNGDCGIIEEVRQGLRVAYVNLVRNHATIGIKKIVRKYMSKELPQGEVEPIYMRKKEWKEQSQPGYAEFKSNLMDAGYRQYLEGMTIENKPKEPFRVYFDYVQGKWVLGELDYVPIRLAYASTVHKSQGLSLENVQIDYSNAFFGSPSMSYVALSRCRTPEGLTIVGSPKLLAARTNVLGEVLPWI